MYRSTVAGILFVFCISEALPAELDARSRPVVPAELDRIPEIESAFAASMVSIAPEYIVRLLLEAFAISI